MSRIRFPRALLVLPLVGACWPVSGQIRSCTSASGGVIYTDRECADLGATDRLARAPGLATAPPPYRGGCAERLRELVSGVTVAIDSREVNRLALYYDWAGVSTRNGYALMEQLDGIVRRPLYAINPIYPRQQIVLDSAVPQTTARREPPIALRLEQTFTSGTTPVRTVFGLRKRQGCWWLKL